MPALQVRELPEETYLRLKQCAADNHRSIAKQTTTLIEEGLARRGYVEGEASGAHNALAKADPAVGGEMKIPPNVKEASERARFVDPFGWASSLAVEPPEVIEARREKRRRLREMAAEIKWIGPQPSLEEIVAMIREDRDSNHGHFVYGLDDRGDFDCLERKDNNE